jgi:Ca2+-binding EF-hand superfamily protein
MSTISGVSSSGDAWAAMKAQRSQHQAKMFAKVDTDGSGGVDKSELQTMMADMASKTGATAGTVSDTQFAKMDANSDGNLSSDELGKSLKDILPPPSTMDFAQSRTDSTSGKDDLFSKIDTNGDGSVSKAELHSLVDKMAADGNSNSTTATSATPSNSSSSSDMFAKLDANGDGSLSQNEFEAGPPQGDKAAHGHQGTQGAGGPPPPPPAGGAGGAGASSSASSTTYDPLDTNQDGVVSLAERLAGSTKSDPVAELMKAIDTDGDNKISSTETDAFISKLTSQIDSLNKSSQTTSSTTTASSSSNDNLDLVKLAQQAYEEIASGLNQQTKGSTLSAVA